MKYVSRTKVQENELAEIWKRRERNKTNYSDGMKPIQLVKGAMETCAFLEKKSN
jgi:hypothetical protein